MTEPHAAPGAPRLTILIPSWNAATSIERAVESVLEDPAIPLECIVIDDGSTDGTQGLVAAIAARDPRVILISIPENGGVSAARNRGLETARGEWLAFLDADDRLLPGGVAALMRPTRDPAVLAVVGQRIWTDGERTWLSPVYDIADIREPGRKSIATHPGLLSYASATGKAFHRSLIDGLAFEGRVLGDQPWTIRALLRAGDGIEVIGDTVYEWTRPRPGGPASTITTASRSSARRSVEIATIARQAFAEVAAEIERTIPDPPTRHALERAYLDRLIRSDLATPMVDAIERGDPATAALFREIAAFLVSIPAPVLASSAFLERRILRPPVGHWFRLDGSARAAYWAIVAAATREGASRTGRLALPLRPGFAVARRFGTPVGTALASISFWIGSVTWALADGLRRRIGRTPR